MTWVGLLVALVAAFVLGWRAHWWYCKHRLGCPLWYEGDSVEWTEELKEEGWMTKNGKHHHTYEFPEHRPTGEVKTPFIDSNNGRVTTPNTNGVDTDVTPRRKT